MKPIKVVIDTDPGVDDAMAVLVALEHPELEVLGLTTVHGNVSVEICTENALRLVEMAGRTDVGVAAGSNELFAGGQPTTATFVHGTDGFGNTHLPKPKGYPLDISAVDFLIKVGLEHPGEVHVLALGPLSNIAFALQRCPDISTKWAGITSMGGAIHMNGNVSPAAEANIMNDPEAADYVFAHGTNVSLVGLDVTSKCELRREDIDLLLGSGKHGNFLHSILQSYHSYYNKVYNVDGVIPHDAVALISMIHDSLFDFRPGSVMVVTEGFSRGQTIWDSGWKKWTQHNVWMDRPKVRVALDVQHEQVMNLLNALITK